MAVIVRPTKSSGGTDVVAGFDVLAGEWNGDLNTIYLEFNGNIDSTNIKTGGVNAANLATDSVTTTKIANNNVTTAKLPDDVIIKSKLKVSKFSWVPGSEVLGSHLANFRDTGLLGANIRILGFGVEASGAPLPGEAQRMIISHYRNTADDKIYLTYHNSSSASSNLSGLTFVMYYVPVS